MLNFVHRLTKPERTKRANRQLGWILAFNAGAINSGAFLAVKQYTSHMTGVVASMADNLVLANLPAVAAAFGACLSFLLGAVTSAILINYAKRHKLASQFALPLLLEAILLLVFGLLGASLLTVQGFFVSITVMLLCFMMGLQNAVITKISNAEIRTTHITGVVTDLGIEIGKLMYWNRLQDLSVLHVVADRDRLRVLIFLIGAFFLGGVSGALGFKYFGYLATIPLAVILCFLAFVPALEDIKRLYKGGSS